MKYAIKMRIDIDGHEELIWAYEIPDEEEYDLILGRPWMDRQQVTVAPAKKSIFIHASQVRIRSREGKKPLPKLEQIDAKAFHAWASRSKKDKSVQVFAASMADIQKALKPKSRIDPRERLPKYLHPEYKFFSKEESDKLPPLRGSSVDHSIEIVERDGKPAEVPYGPLYSMSRDELLVLRKELTAYLDKGFIRVSRSSAAAPVLFVKKPGGGLRFCVDFRALNAITRKDRYPLPLIHETLAQLSKARWFTKVDVMQAFHRIRIAEGDEWKTAFRTRFGLYEWLVTPFGLANAPSTFQRYINWTLREYLDVCCSAYMDDVIIFSDGTQKDHEAKVKEIVQKLGQAGLHMDVSKSEFSVKKTKYLGFIIEAGKGISMDPDKVTAIRMWEAPQSVKGVRSFIGFANFYRKFIRNFSDVVEPLTRLTGKLATFVWGLAQQEAFDKLKKAFTANPALVNFSPEAETILECDASGWAVGGVLSQFGDDELLHPVAYFSAKNSPAEVNYTIHDKELLAVIKCLEEWKTELRQVGEFEVITDHKNLVYFCKNRLLTERHVRWSSILSQFNLKFRYRPGKSNGRADALSRKEEDVPDNADDERLKTRHFQLLQPVVHHVASKEEAGATFCFNGRITEEEADPPMDDDPIEDRWETAAQDDEEYTKARNAVRDGMRKFPPELQLKVTLAECSIDQEGHLRFRGRKWVPKAAALRTHVIAEVHNSPVAGHPGREVTYSILHRDYFWPGMSASIRQFVKNCDVCGRTKPWREMKHGLLKPLPVPDRIWKEISMDFVTGLPESDGCTNLMVVTDRLSKDVVLTPLADLNTTTVAKAFIRDVVAYHWLPDAIVSDRGGQFLSEFWITMCEMLSINRRVSTSHHPQTDGATERMNSVVEAYLRAYVNWSQNDWAPMCPIAQIAIKGRNAASTGFSPFFLQHGYDVDPLQDNHNQVVENLHRQGMEPSKAALAMTAKFKEVFDFVQAKMADAQQEQERFANRHRQEAPLIRAGDKVWLQYGHHLSNGRPSKKLDWKNGKYTVKRLVTPHVAELDLPPGTTPTFHVDRLRLHPSRPLEGQESDDWQPPAIMETIDGEEVQTFEVEDIIGERWKKVGRGKKKQYLVKWVGNAMTTWEPEKELQEAEALDRWLEFSKTARNSQGNVPEDLRKGAYPEPK